MKNKVLTLCLTALMMLVTQSLLAYDFEADGIYYNITSTAKLKVEVTSGSNYYSGDVTIPATVTYNGKNYSVISICEQAFLGCSDLTNITIPNSVISIGRAAFGGCGLTSITIPNSVTSIGNSLFGYCASLTSINVDAGNTKYDSRNDCNAIIETKTNTLIAGCCSTTIPNSVTCIGDYAFSHCSSLTSITIHDGVTSIGDYAFYGCSNLTSLTINGVTSIGSRVFQECSNLSNLTFNGVTSIGDYAFVDCINLTSVTMPSSVTSIGWYVFYGCSSLSSVIIPSTVTSITRSAFSKCGDLETVICYAENVPDTWSNAFDDSYVEYATLIVPEASLQAYQSTAPWSGFGNFKTIEESVCATPVITIENGVVTATSATEGAECFLSYKLLGTVGNRPAVEVSAYAMAEGYQQSLTATKTLDFSLGSRGDIDGDGDVTVGDVVTLANYILGK